MRLPVGQQPNTFKAIGFSFVHWWYFGVFSATQHLAHPKGSRNRNAVVAAGVLSDENLLTVARWVTAAPTATLAKHRSPREYESPFLARSMRVLQPIFLGATAS